jgi:GTP-binding protein EngB required for normal cell division
MKENTARAPSGSPPPTLPNESRLLTLARLAQESGADGVATAAKNLAERVVAGRFYVACLGQFKRGKSSLLNALVGRQLLPVGVVPITAAVTVMRHGQQVAAGVRFLDGREQEIDLAEVASFVSEDGNPQNAKGVAAVEVFVPSPLLESGMCLVDTPGVGSVFEGNTAVTRGFVPHIDAALLVLGADPPISADELSLVQDLSRHTSELLFVLNKSDRLPDTERREARIFAERVLSEKLERPVTVLEVSAAEQLAGDGPARDWAQLCGRLGTLAKQSGADLVRSAEERGSQLLATQLVRELTERRDALVRPLEESQKRLDDLRVCVAEAERSLGDLAFLFDAEEARLGREFERWTSDFLQRGLPDAQARFKRTLDSAQTGGKLGLRPAAFAAAQKIYLAVLSPWLPDAQRAAESLYVEASLRFVKLANDFLDRLASSGDAALAGLPRNIGPETGFRVRSRLFYTELWGLTGRGLFLWLADLLGSRRSVRHSVERSVGSYLDRIIRANASRIQGDFAERVRESRWRLQAEIKGLLKNIAALAERALERARERRAAGAEAVKAEIERIDKLLERTEVVVHRQGKEITP